MLENWRQKFLDNYNGVTQEAKDLEPFLKENYKGNPYLPWATMEKAMLLQDPESSVDVVLTKDDNPVWTQVMQVETIVEGKQTVATMFIHMIKVEATFMGKTVVELYPVQNNAYEAPKVIDQNMVNKAIQRAKVKAISRVTGLGLRLYEGQDLQFDAPQTPITNVPTTTTTPAPKVAPIVGTSTATLTAEAPTPQQPTTTVAPTPKQDVPQLDSDEITQIATKIHGNNKLMKGLQLINNALVKKKGFVLDINDSIPTLVEKLKQIANPSVTYKAILKQSGVSEDEA